MLNKIAAILLISLPSVAFSQTTHECQVFSIVQRYDAASMKFKSATEATTTWFNVTNEPHETPKTLDVIGANIKIGEAEVWTGTLLKTTEGDVIQAHANFTIEGVSGSANLTMSLDSSLAKASVVLDTQSGSDLLLIPVDLKCVKL